MSNSRQQARIDLAAAHRLAVMDGLNEGTWNHLSLVAPDNTDHVLVSPGWCHWKQVKAGDLITINGRGEKVDGAGEFDRGAYCIHYPIHAAQPEAKCVLHTHPPYASALSMVQGARLEMADQNALCLYDRVAYYEGWDGFVFDLDHGKRIADVLGDKRVLVMSNHGVLVVGPTVAEAYADLYHLERACMFQCHARAWGGTLRPVPQEYARAAPAVLEAGGNKHKYFAAMKRLLDAEQPDYAD